MVINMKKIMKAWRRMQVLRATNGWSGHLKGVWGSVRSKQYVERYINRTRREAATTSGSNP